MPQYLTPGVYIEEIPGPKPIEGVGTATGAFIGIAEKGPIGEAKLITNWTQFVETYGSYISYGYLANAVNQFFAEGGTRCYVVRTCHYDFSATPAIKKAITGAITVLPRVLPNASPKETLKVEALSSGSWSDNIWVEIGDAKKVDPTNTKFRLVVWNKDREVESYEELTMMNIEARINGNSKYIKVSNLGITSTDNRPVRSEVEFQRIPWAEQISNTTNKLNRVFFINNLNGWAVGDNGVALYTEDGGEKWQQKPIIVSGVEKTINLNAGFQRGNVVWIVGNDGKIFITADAGISWNEQKNPASVLLRSIFFVDDNHGWVAGEKGTVLYTEDEGDTWQVKSIIINGSTVLTKLTDVIQEGNNVWIVGMGGKIYKTSDLGSSWTEYSVSGVSAQLNCVFFINDTHGWAVGNGGVILFWNGINWTTKLSGVNIDLTSIYFITDKIGWVVGADGTILYTTDGGATPASWTAQRCLLKEELNCIRIFDNKKGWIVGNSGKILNMTMPIPISLRVMALKRNLTLTITSGSDLSIAEGFRLQIFQAAALVDEFDNLTMSNVERKVNGVSKFIKVKILDVTRPDNVSKVDLNLFALKDGWDGLVGTVLKDRAAKPNNTLEVSAFRDGVTLDIVKATADSNNNFKLIVKFHGAQVEVFDELNMATVEEQINGTSEYIEVNNLHSSTPLPENRPQVTLSSEFVPLGLADMDFIGDEANKNGLHAFDPIDDINILAIPDRPGDREVAIAAYTYCQNRKDCFFVADPPIGLEPLEVLAYKEGTGIFAGNAFNSSYAALYYPWAYIVDPLTGRNKLVPPSGAVVGTYSGTDVVRGVHKAPAGTIDGYLNSAVGIERLITKGEQELLNPAGINVIRSFPGAGIVIWGARTVSADPEWKYVNVRRLLLYIEESIDQATQWVVFEPNSPALWESVKRDVRAFLTTVWRTGALFGLSPEEAFFVKVDSENNPPAERALGRLYIDIGVAPVKPAEFVIFRITQMTQES